MMQNLCIFAVSNNLYLRMKRTVSFLAALLLGMAVCAQETCKVFFDLNYDTPEAPLPVTVKTGRMMPLAAKVFPTREGHRFGGWYTAPECRPEQEWRQNA